MKRRHSPLVIVTPSEQLAIRSQLAPASGPSVLRLLVPMMYAQRITHRGPRAWYYRRLLEHTKRTNINAESITAYVSLHCFQQDELHTEASIHIINASDN